MPADSLSFSESSEPVLACAVGLSTDPDLSVAIATAVDMAHGLLKVR